MTSSRAALQNDPNLASSLADNTLTRVLRLLLCVLPTKPAELRLKEREQAETAEQQQHDEDYGAAAAAAKKKKKGKKQRVQSKGRR